MAPKPEPARLAFCLRDGSCDGGGHPSDHDAQFGCAERVTDLPASTFAFVLRQSTRPWTPAGVLPPPALAVQPWAALTHARTHSMSRGLAGGSASRPALSQPPRDNLLPKRGSISGLHHGTRLRHTGSECVVSVPIEADIDAKIGARLAEVRRRCGLTQRQLAKAVGVQDSPELGVWAHRALREAPGRAC
jgi:hypothetical protein